MPRRSLINSVKNSGPAPPAEKQGPLNNPEIEGKAFNARLVPIGESVRGFFYFEATSTNQNLQEASIRETRKDIYASKCRKIGARQIRRFLSLASVPTPL